MASYSPEIVKTLIGNLPPESTEDNRSQQASDIEETLSNDRIHFCPNSGNCTFDIKYSELVKQYYVRCITINSGRVLVPNRGVEGYKFIRAMMIKV